MIGDKSVTQEERILNLEKRMSTLERILKDGRKKLNEIVDNWENVIFEFAETFGIEYPKSKQKEGKSMKVNKSEGLDFQFNENILRGALRNISNAYLDLYNSIVENQLESSEMRYGVAKDITKEKTDQLKSVVNAFIDLQCKMYCDLCEKLSEK